MISHHVKWKLKMLLYMAWRNMHFKQATIPGVPQLHYHSCALILGLWNMTGSKLQQIQLHKCWHTTLSGNIYNVPIMAQTWSTAPSDRHTKLFNIILWHLTGMQTAVWWYCLYLQCWSLYIELTHRWLDSSQMWCCDFGWVVPYTLKDYSAFKTSGTTPLNGTASHPRRLSSSQTWMRDPQSSQIIYSLLLLFCYILQLLSTILWQHIYGLNI